MMHFSIKSLESASVMASVETMSSWRDTGLPFSTSAIALLFDYLIGMGKDIRRNRDAYLLASLQIDH